MKMNIQEYENLIKLGAFEYDINIFQCQICGINYERNRESIISLLKRITHLRKEICCNCSVNVKSNMVKENYNLLIKRFLKMIKNYYDTNLLDNNYNISLIYNISLEIHNIRTFYKF